MALPTFQELQQRTYRLMGENANATDNPNVPLADVKAALNDAMSEVVRRLDHDYFRTSVTTDATAAAITVAPDFLCHLQVMFVDSSRNQRMYLTPKTLVELDEQNPGWRDVTSDRPTGYVLQLNTDGTTKILLTPPLSGTVVNGLIYTYSKKPTDMSANTDTPLVLTWFPEQQRTALPYWAAAKLLRYEASDASDPMALAADKFDALFEREIQRMHGTLNRLTKGVSTWRR